MSRAKTKYVQVPESSIPVGVRFDTPRRNQGQTVEVSYGGHDRAEHDEGDEYMCIEDRSVPSTRYYRRAKM